MASGGIATADTLTADAYRARLRDVRALLQTAKGTAETQRAPVLDAARALLRSTTAIQTADGTLAIDDGALAARITSDTVDREIAELDRFIVLADAALQQRVDAPAADAALRRLTNEHEVGQRLDLGQIVGSLVGRFAQWLYDLMGRPDPNVLLDAQAIVGVFVALAIVVLLVRGTRERIRRETALGAVPGERRADPAGQLRLADDAWRAGRPREAIHALYLYAFAMLAAREAIRYDPALTDHELLRRAAGIPHAGALGDLVQLHERVWFGLRDARESDVARARDLATEAVK